MADVPTSPRPEAEQPSAAPLSSSPNPQAAALLSGSPDNQLGADATPAVAAAVTGADTGAEADAEVDAEPEPVAPRLDPAGFFALVSNASTNTTHHPTVKYIFLDDDPDTLTTALAAHDAANQASTPSASASKPAAAAKNASPNRAVLLDVVPGADGQWEVSSAASLSADFAVTEASISRQAGEKEGGLVLKIEGVEGGTAAAAGAAGDRDRAESLPSSNSGVARSGSEDYGPLLDDFERRMGVLRRVVKAGEGRAEKARELKHAAEAEPRRDAEE
ncbi:hypothetical protein EsH8_VII_000467 [Colletotrichum jinshuiense]